MSKNGQIVPPDERAFYTLNQHNQEEFYKFPKYLFSSEFDGMSNDAKLLYMVLRDRHSISVKNNYVDGNGRIYLLMTQEKMCCLLRVTPPTIRKCLKQLKDNKLMYEVRQGKNKANRIYLLQYSWIEKNLLSSDSGQKNICSHDGKNLSTSNTDISNTENYKKESNESPHESKERTTFNEIVDNYTGNPELREALYGYIQMRCRKNKAFVNRVLILLLKKLDTISAYDSDKINAVDTSTRNGWGDFYAPKNDNPPVGEQLGSFDTNDFFQSALKRSYEAVDNDKR